MGLDSEVYTMTQYVLLDSNNAILNTIMYDPKGKWKPEGKDHVGIIPDGTQIQIGGTLVGSNYTPPTVHELPDEIKKDLNKLEAKRRLTESDWVGLADAREKLSNVSEWDAYRASLRDFIINPKTDKLPKPLKTVTWKS